MRHRSWRWVARIGLAAVLPLPAPLVAWVQGQTPTQTLASADRRPRFWMASPGIAPSAVDPQQVSVLRQRITVHFDGVSLKTALAEIARQARLPFMYSLENLPLDARIQFRAEHITVAGALAEVLVDTDLDVLISADDRIGLVKRGTLAEVRGPVGTLVGHVTDSATGRGIGGVEIFLDRTRWRTTTDTAGRYRLAEVDTGSYTLTARRLGYAKRSRRVAVPENREDTADVVMPAVVARLQELVTTATGRQRRRDIANDVTVLNADSIVRTEAITSVTDLLEARVPGLTVQRTSGAPGDPARLRLRGAGSPLRSNDPIVVVDGVRAYAEQSADRSGNLVAENFAAPSPLDYIDPNSIETIEVLKGPSAATLYGQDAANGVIVITTKKGKAGPTRWTASADYGQTRMEGEYPNLLVRWGHSPATDARVYCPIEKEREGACQADSVASFQILNDPATTVLDHGRRRALTLNASGGSAALTYAVTGSFQDELGLIRLPDFAADAYQSRLGNAVPDWMRRPQHFTQWGVTSQLTARLGATAELSLTTALSRQTQQRSSLEDQLSSLMSTYFDRTTNTYYGPTAGDVQPITGSILQSYYQRVTDIPTDFTNAVNLNWHPRSWLTVSADAGLNLIHRGDESLLPRGASPIDTSGYLNSGKATSLQSTVNLRANAVAPIGRGFTFRVAAGVNYAGISIDDQTLRTRNLPAGEALIGTLITGGERVLRDDATFGWYIEPSVGNNKFNFSSGLRLDGGSSYGNGVSGFQLPKFPKIGFTYLISDEPWFPLKDLFQSLRVRVAYGKASRQPGITDRLRVYSATAQRWVDGGFGDVVLLASLGNTVLRPERTTEFEGGVDADFLDNRFTLSVTGYRKTTDDALLPVPVAPSVYGGNVNVVRNIGVIRNTGLELTLGAQLVRGGPVTLGTQLGVSQNRNLVVRLGPGVNPFYLSSISSSEAGSRVAPGYPLFGRWATPTVGYADANGDGVLEAGEIILGDTAVYVGQTMPNYTANLHTTLGLWQNAVAITAGFAYEDGLSQQNFLARNLGPFSHGSNDPTASLAEQVLVASPAFAFHETQTVNTLRFNSLAIGYTLPRSLSRRIGAERLQVSLQGSNLGLWTNYRGLDPNVNSFATGNSVQGGAVLPQPRSWQVRVNATY